MSGQTDDDAAQLQRREMSRRHKKRVENKKVFHTKRLESLSLSSPLLMSFKEVVN